VSSVWVCRGTTNTIQRRYNVSEEGFWIRNSSLKFTKQLVQKAKSSSQDEICQSKAMVDLKCKSFECGKWKLGSDNSSNAGNQTSDMPSLALLFNVRKKITCTFTIVSPIWLIGSISCVANISMDTQEWVVFGGTPGSSPLGHSATQIKIVKSLIPHPRAKQGSHLMDNDFLLVELMQPLSLDNKIQATCLATSAISEADNCFSAGWFQAKTDGVSFVQYLSSVERPSISIDSCNSTDFYNGMLSDSMFCAGNNTSPANPGSPLMCISPSGFWHLHGLTTSWLGRQSDRRPQVYSSIVSVREWIDNTIGTRL